METNQIETESQDGSELRLASRIENIPRSFIREMLKTANSKNTISFAGGLPDESLMPVEALNAAFQQAVSKYGSKLFQYANSEGFLPLREWIAERYYQKHGLNISAENILITNGSQQAFDLIGKIFIEKGNSVIIEQPGYLGVIQSLLCFEPELVGVPLDNNGMRPDWLKKQLLSKDPKLIHVVPNFQNPSGISYTQERRATLTDLLLENNIAVIEDDPYGELYYDERVPGQPFKSLLADKGILLGTFSKTLSPGMRLGWIVAEERLINKLLIAKQASDLHTNNLSQMMTYEYLVNNDYEKHLAQIRNCYKSRRDKMIESIKKYFPQEVDYTKPGGGMFIWCSLPDHVSSRKLMQIVLDADVVIVPGEVFSLEGVNTNSFRLNFSNATDEEIQMGIEIIGKAIKYLLSKNQAVA